MQRRALLTLVLALSTTACGGDTTVCGADGAVPDAPAESDAGSEPDAPIGPKLDSGPEDTGAQVDVPTTDARPPTCPPVPSHTIVDIPPNILAARMTHWTCDNLYILSGVVIVHSPDPTTPQ